MGRLLFFNHFLKRFIEFSFLPLSRDLDVYLFSRSFLFTTRKQKIEQLYNMRKTEKRIKYPFVTSDTCFFFVEKSFFLKNFLIFSVLTVGVVPIIQLRRRLPDLAFLAIFWLFPSAVILKERSLSAT